MTLGFAYAIDLKVDNNCPFPIWLATLPNFGQNPLPDGVRQLNTGASYTYNVNIFWYFYFSIICVKYVGSFLTLVDDF